METPDQTSKNPPSAIPTSTISRDIKLLIAGALISFISSISTTYINGLYEEQKDLKNKKYAIVEQLSKDLGLRLYITQELHKANNSHIQKQIDSAMKKFTEIQERFNSLNTVYEVQLSKFFSDDNRRFYEDSVHGPLRDLGEFVGRGDTSKHIDEKGYSRHYHLVDTTNYLFIRRLYNTIK